MNLFKNLGKGIKKFKNDLKKRAAEAPARAERRRNGEIKRLQHKLKKEELLDQLSQKRSTRQERNLAIQEKRTKMMNARQRAMPDFLGLNMDGPKKKRPRL